MIYEEMKKFHHENSRKYHSTDSSELLLVETEYYSYRNFLPSAYSLAADWKVKFSLIAYDKWSQYKAFTSTEIALV